MNHFDLNAFPLWTALITPLNSDGSIDFPGLSKLVLAQQQAGNGILLCGSTGEGLALSQPEQQAIVEHVVALQPTVPLMVAVGGSELAKQQQWLTWLNQQPISAYLLSSPLYAKPGPVGQQRWFESLLDVATKPCMLYNVPSRAGVELAPSAVAMLANHRNCWALKEASGSIHKFEQFRQAAPHLAIYSGDDSLTPYFAQAGAKGLVSVCANVWPEATAEYVRQALRGNNNLLSPWSQATATLFTVANPIPVKCLMHAKGLIAHPTLRPPLYEQELSSLDAQWSADAAIGTWYSRNS